VGLFLFFRPPLHTLLGRCYGTERCLHNNLPYSQHKSGVHAAGETTVPVRDEKAFSRWPLLVRVGQKDFFRGSRAAARVASVLFATVERAAVCHPLSKGRAVLRLGGALPPPAGAQAAGFGRPLARRHCPRARAPPKHHSPYGGPAQVGSTGR
jgi:hypothetical protein